ncbi:MAG: thioredoxin family protein [Chitinophagaceae bacterium]|jgi:thioredoxin-related protein|nr:thioredoxin family protein [Chitinophagaceae bacterium]
MKKILFAILPLVAITLLALKPFNVLPIGSTMPKADIKMKDISGKEVSLKDAKKKQGLLVMFSCNTCPYVIKNQDRTINIAAYASKKNVGVILLNSNEGTRNGGDSYNAMKQYADNQKYSFYYTIDKNSELADAFGANRTPECFLFDENDKLVYHGAIDDNPSNASAVEKIHLKNAIDQMVAGKEVAVKETRSVGCSIKRSK